MSFGMDKYEAGAFFNALLPQASRMSIVCSVMLLPGAKQSTDAAVMNFAATTPAGQKQGNGKIKPSMKAPSSRLEWQQHMGGGKSGKADGTKKMTSVVDPDLLLWPYADLQTGNELPGECITYMTGAKHLLVASWRQMSMFIF